MTASQCELDNRHAIIILWVYAIFILWLWSWVRHARSFNTAGIPCHGPFVKKHLREIATPDWVGQFYPSQTKILEGGTKEEMRILKALFKGVSTQFGPCSIEKSVENPDIIFCSSFQNLRLGSISLRTNVCVLTQSGVAISRKLCFPHGRPVPVWRTKNRAISTT